MGEGGYENVGGGDLLRMDFIAAGTFWNIIYSSSSQVLVQSCEYIPSRQGFPYS